MKAGPDKREGGLDDKKEKREEREREKVDLKKRTTKSSLRHFVLWRCPNFFVSSHRKERAKIHYEIMG